MADTYQLPVQVQLAGDKDYRVSRIPAAVQGQSYVVLSTSSVQFSDRNIIAGPAILEVCHRQQRHQGSSSINVDVVLGLSQRLDPFHAASSMHST